MYYYLVCKFFNNNLLTGKPYAYTVDEKNFRLAKIGYHYKIRNSDGYTYNNAVVEITGKYITDVEQIIYDNKLYNKYDSPTSGITPKRLVELVWFGKNLKADALQDSIKANTDKSLEIPILYNYLFYSCIDDIILDTQSIRMKKKEIKPMNKIFGNVEFGRYTGNGIKMSIGGLAYRTDNNKYVAYDKSKLTITDVTDFTFDMDGLLYLFPVAIKDIRVGDIVRHGDSYVIVKDISGGNFLEVIEPRSNEVKNILPLRNIFGFDFYTKVVSLMGEGALGTIDESNPFGNMLPFFLMMGDKNNDGFDAKTFMLMTYLNGGAMDFQNNPWLMCMLMDNKGDMGDILPLMLISNNGFNFGANKTCPYDKNKES